MSGHEARGPLGRHAIQGSEAGSPVTGQTRRLEGRQLAMYGSLMLSDRSTLRLWNPRPRLVATFGEQKRPMSSLERGSAE
jgi:hypothetical protein